MGSRCANSGLPSVALSNGGCSGSLSLGGTPLEDERPRQRCNAACIDGVLAPGPRTAHMLLSKHGRLKVVPAHSALCPRGADPTGASRE